MYFEEFGNIYYTLSWVCVYYLLNQNLNQRENGEMKSQNVLLIEIEMLCHIHDFLYLALMNYELKSTVYTLQLS